MEEIEKQRLVGRTGYRFKGQSCAVGGWRNEQATVAPLGGGFYIVPWESVAEAARGDGNIPESGAVCRSNAWLGVWVKDE